MNTEPAPQSVLAWMGQTLSRPSSRSDAISEMEANSPAESPSKKKGVLYLPAYFVRGDDGTSSSSSQQLSPSSSASSQQLQANGLSPLSHAFAPSSATGQSLGQWASSLLPANWRGPSPAPSHGSRRSRMSQDLESLGSQGEDDDDQEAEWNGGRGDEQRPLMEYPSTKSRLRQQAWQHVSHDGANDHQLGHQAPPPYVEDGETAALREKQEV